MLPTAVAAGFLAFLAAVGPGASVVSAAPGDVCAITGPTNIGVGQEVDYTAYVQDPDLSGNHQTELNVDLDDHTGDTDITSINDDKVPATDSLNDENLLPTDHGCVPNATTTKSTVHDYIIEAIDRGEECSSAAVGPLPFSCQTPFGPGENGGGNDFGGPLYSYQDNDIDCGLVNVLGDTCAISNAVVTAVVNSIVDSVSAGDSCTVLANDAESAALDAGATEFVGGQIEDFILNYDHCAGIPGFADGMITVDVTCNTPGIFDLSFAVKDGGAKSIQVVCAGDVETGEIFSVPTSVEINPSVANVAHSLVWVSLKGKDGEISTPGTKVLWTSDRCSIENSTVMDENSFEAAEALFRGVNPLNPATAQAVEQSTYATTGPDGASRQQEEGNTFSVTSSDATGNVQRTVAAVILHCDPIHAPSVTPGPATITAFVDRGELNDNNIANNDDLVLKTTVTVVGPPAANGVTVTAAPATLTCGEKATISVDVKDAIGQPVSDHTLVEAVTNAGGVLAGTGAVAGQAGLVTPVSSTVAETFGGKATFYLLTSTANVGNYEVVITTGGGGGVTGQLQNGGVSTNLLGGLFTTAPISVQVTVQCSVPTVAPVVSAPAGPSTTGPTTGQGIRPPSTGDAGLVSGASSSSSTSWTAAAGVAAIVAVIIGAVALKPRRLED
jgi:hypothetical protein